MNVNHRFTRLLPSVVILFFLLATTTAAQADRASISGTVTDKSGAMISGRKGRAIIPGDRSAP